MKRNARARRALSALAAFAIVCLAACVPAQVTPPVPPPATPFVIADGRFTSGDLSLRIPDGWRVVTGEAGAPLQLTLVAPDECGVIVVSATPLEAPVRSPTCADAPLREELRTVEMGSVRYSVSLSAPEADWEAFTRAAERVTESMEAG